MRRYVTEIAGFRLWNVMQSDSLYLAAPWAADLLRNHNCQIIYICCSLDTRIFFRLSCARAEVHQRTSERRRRAWIQHILKGYGGGHVEGAPRDENHSTTRQTLLLNHNHANH
jgi:hypothetical protein